MCRTQQPTWQVLGSYLVLILKNQRPLDYVTKFAHISRPVIFLEHRRRFGRESFDLFSAPDSRADRVDVILRQLQHVVATIAQRRNVDLNDRESIVQVESKTTSLALRFQIAI